MTLADLFAHDPIAFVRDVEAWLADAKSLQANPPITMTGVEIQRMKSPAGKMGFN